MKTCKNCSKNFEIDAQDNDFRAKISPIINGQKYLIPEPSLCPDCRFIRRISWRNERHLYKRKCNASGKEIISVFSPDSPYIVYEQSEWWSSNWDATDYGQEFDFSRPFFAQFNELLPKVPLVSLWNYGGENAEYNNNCFQLKDSYMNVNTDKGERNFYTYASVDCNDVSDCFFVQEGELSHECLDSKGIYKCYYCHDVQNSSECYFSSDLIGCKNCFACHGLRQKEYCIYNKQYSKAEYEKQIAGFKFTHSNIQKMQEESYKVYLQVPKKNLKMTKCQNSKGNYLLNCNEVLDSFDVSDCDNLKYAVYSPGGLSNSQDVYASGLGAEWLYEFMGGPGAYNSAFIVNASGNLSDSYYCLQCCNNSKNLFGCVSLKKKEYCILNKQYTKEEYEALLPRIIQHMQQTGEWGEFFPSNISIFAYNETLANEYAPLREVEARAKGLEWKEENNSLASSHILEASTIPENILDTSDDIIHQVYKCEETGKPYKIVKQELDQYRKLGVAVPRICPDQRYLKKAKQRDPKKLFSRHCAKCQTQIESTFSPQRPELVYCEACYTEAING